MSLRNVCPKNDEYPTEVRLINVSEEKDFDIESMESVQNFIKTSLISHLCPNREKIIESISKYRKESDQILQLCSLFLKSAVCNETPKRNTKNRKGANKKSPTETNLECRERVIVELPRTKFGKPYLPSSDVDFSLSHQYPFIGIAASSKSIGMDIVVMEDRDLHYFEDSFTSWEWSEIKKDINQFYLYWAAKEAYTKLIGLGLSLEFKSFEIRLPSNAKWQLIRKEQNGVFFQVQIKTSRETNHFSFLFYPMLGYTFDACACVCCARDFKINVQWIKMTDLIDWHNGKRKDCNSV